jgi:ZIP family zinc transporter
MTYISLILTIICGLFFLIGIILYKKSHNKEKLSNYAVSIAFTVMIGLIIFDLVPEIKESFSYSYLVAILLGIFILKFLDLFVPNHEHNHKEKNDNLKEHKAHLYHIGIITILALFLHNLIEGASLCAISLNDLKAGSLMCLGVSLHNLPFGFEIGSYLSDKKNTTWYIILLVLSAFLGGLITILFGMVNDYLEGILISITIGMILYIVVFELSKEMWEKRYTKDIYYGMLLGVIIMLLAFNL